MPTITPSDALAGKLRGMGMHIKVDPSAARNLAGARGGDSFEINYAVKLDGTEGIAGGTATATLTVKLDDPAGLFDGHSIVAVLSNLISQIVEARLSEPAKLFVQPGDPS